MSKILLITGGSKGIGKGIIDAYLKHGFKIFSISRTKNNHLKNIEQIEFDLCRTAEISDLLTQQFQKFQFAEVEKITLINNAGTLGKIDSIENVDDIANTVTLNTIAPLVLTAAFIGLTDQWIAVKNVINISSGAAYKPYSGWAVYCASKAAIDMMTKAIALEQEIIKNGVKIIAIYPGVVDTEMQSKIRGSSRESFASIDRFLALKATNALSDPATVGEKIYAIANDSSIANGSLIRVDE